MDVNLISRTRNKLYFENWFDYSGLVYVLTNLIFQTADDSYGFDNFGLIDNTLGIIILWQFPFGYFYFTDFELFSRFDFGGSWLVVGGLWYGTCIISTFTILFRVVDG